MVRVGTLGDCERERRVVTVYCGENHSASWPAWYLAQQFGSEMGLQRFMDRTRCARCRQRAAGLTVTTFAHGMGIALDRPPGGLRPPPALADPVRAIGALAVALCGPDRRSTP